MNAVEEVLAGLRGLGSVQDLRNAAQHGLAPASRPRVNSHIHLPPNFSAFQSVAQAADLAAAQQVRVVGVTNYYDYNVYGDFAQLARQRQIFPLFGLEVIALIEPLIRAGVKINDPGNPGRIYVCGKGITRFAPMPPEAERYLAIIRRNDSQRMAAMVAKLAAIFEQRGLATGLTESAIIDGVVQRYHCPRNRVYLQERHICQAFQERFFELVPKNQREEKLARILGAPSRAAGDPVKIQNEIRSHLMKAGKPAFVEEKFLSLEDAHRFILATGGLPCYPTLADGANPICPYEEPLDRLVDHLRQQRFYCAEFIPIRNTPQVLALYVKGLRQAGLVITAGTEHNTLDLLPIEPTCLNAQPVPDDIREIFWEGACVVAAHQFLMLHGECGFVDAEGNPNAAYPTAEDRIAAFRMLGAAVIERYFQTVGK